MSLELRVGRPWGGLARAYADGEAGAGELFGASWRDPAAYRRAARSVDDRFDDAARRRAADMLVPAGESARERLDAVLASDGYLVTTGQQPGLLGGPLYSVYKALTAVALARRLETLLERPVLPVFWVASEDHDWDEVDHAHLIDVENQLHRLSLEPVEGARDRPLHRLPLGPDVEEVVARAALLLPDSDFSARWVGLLEGAWTAGTTLPAGFRDTLAGLLEPFGVCFVDAAQPDLKEASLPVLRREVEEAAAHEALLAERTRAVEAAGWDVQVPVLEGGVNLFVEGPGGRERLYRDDGGFHLRHSGTRLTPDELERRLAEEPGTVSPNVLLRPVVESAVLPTVAYVAGPGESAYWAQLPPLFEAHGVGMPVVVPRLSATAVESKVGKVLEKYGLEVEALSRPFHEIAGDLARDEVPDGVQRALGELRGAIGKGTSRLVDEARSVDPTLKGPIQHARTVAFDALEDAERKIVQAVKRESEIALQQIEKARLHLFPDGRPQERVLNVFYYLARYGEAFLEDVLDAFGGDLGGAVDVSNGEGAPATASAAAPAETPSADGGPSGTPLPPGNASG